MLPPFGIIQRPWRHCYTSRPPIHLDLARATDLPVDHPRMRFEPTQDKLGSSLLFFIQCLREPHLRKFRGTLYRFTRKPIHASHFDPMLRTSSIVSDTH